MLSIQENLSKVCLAYLQYKPQLTTETFKHAQICTSRRLQHGLHNTLKTVIPRYKRYAYIGIQNNVLAKAEKNDFLFNSVQM